MKTSVSVLLREPVRALRVRKITYHPYGEAPLKKRAVFNREEHGNLRISRIKYT